MISTRDRLVAAASELYRRQGYTGTGVKQILTLAEAPYGSLYHHFPGGKAELTAEAIRLGGVVYAALVVEQLDEHRDDLAAGLRAAFRGAGEAVAASGWQDACPIETIALEVASTDDDLRREVDAVFTMWTEALADRAVGFGMTSERARSFAQVVVSSLEGAFILARTSQSTEALDACGDAMAALADSLLP